MMRFTSRDPVRGYREEPLTLHRYLHCTNNPLFYVDPTGEKGETLVAPIIAGHAYHALAITAVAYGVATMNWDFIDFGVSIDMNLGKLMALAAGGIVGAPALRQTIILPTYQGNYDRKQEQEFYEWIHGIDKKMSGDEPPEGFWKALLWSFAKMWDNFTTGSGT